MKRNALSTSLKDRNFVTSKNMGIGCNRQKVREPWDCHNHGYEQVFVDGFAWPPRSYTCSFCMREFRSAQALGGHMNVHRRDRARLRQSPPPPPQARSNHQCSTPANHNPNPNFPSSSASCLPTFPSRHHKSFLSALPTLVSSSFSASSRLSSTSPVEMQKWVNVDGLNHFSPKTPESTFYQENQRTIAFTSEDQTKMLKKTEIIRLDLEIGLFDDLKGDLDLELRLGSS